MVRIPSEYQEVEYLESTGTQWIKTDIEGRFSASFESEVIFTSSQDSYSVGFKEGTFQLAGNGYYGNKTQIGYAATYSNGPSGSLTLSKRHKYKTVFEPGKQEVHVDDKLVSTFVIAKNADTLTGAHFGIFARLNNDTSASLFSKVKMYYLKISDGGELLGHFIPCYRKSDNKPGMYDTVSGTFYVNSGTGEFLVGNNVYYDTTNLLESRRRILLTTPHLESPTPANPLTFKSNMTTKLKEGKVYFTPVQEGTGDPSPDNVRPITGWDGITVTRTGKNLFSGEQIWKLCTPYASISEDENGRYVTPGNVLDFINFPDGIFKEKTQYTFIMKTYASIEVAFYVVLYSDGSNSSITAPVGLNTFAFVTAAGKTVKGIRPMNRSATRRFYYEESGVFEGNLTTDTYEPYQGSTITIPFPKTIYGGYVDLVNGEVVEEWESFVLDGEENNIREFNRGQNAHRFDFYLINLHGSAKVASTEWLCDRMAYDNSSSALFGTFRMYRTTNLVIGNGDNTLADLDAFKQWLSENTPEFCAPLETPIHHTIDPQVIRPLKGVTNIWSDANGNIEVKFWKH